MLAFTQAADGLAQRYERAPEPLRQSFLPFAIATLPLLVGSAFAPQWMVPVILLLSLVLLHQVAIAAEPMMFAITKVRAHLAVTMPMCGLVSVWGIALALMGRPGVMLAIVGPYCLLLLLACAPAYRLREARQVRRVPLKYSYPAVAALVWLAAIHYVIAGR